MAVRLAYRCSGLSSFSNSLCKSLMQRTSSVFCSARKFSIETQQKDTPEPEKHKSDNGKTKDNPIMVASHSNRCIVGCVCAPDMPSVNWFYVEDGPAQICDCGFYFKLERVTSEQWIPEFSRIMSVSGDLRDPRNERTGIPFKSYFVKEDLPRNESTSNEKSWYRSKNQLYLIVGYPKYFNRQGRNFLLWLNSKSMWFCTLAVIAPGMLHYNLAYLMTSCLTCPWLLSFMSMKKLPSRTCNYMFSARFLQMKWDKTVVGDINKNDWKYCNLKLLYQRVHVVF